ncbi:MAG TPA: pantoate--beta-alanine ligase, partial [Rhodanobacteraceae bacterium]
PEQRARAAFIHETLRRMQAEVHKGAVSHAAVEANAEAALRGKGFDPDYAVVRRADDLGVPAVGQSRALIALIAAKLGSTRLIDNLLLDE